MRYLSHAALAVVLLIPGMSFSQQRAATQRYGSLPLNFEANQGQADSQVKFLSRGKGYTAFLTAGDLTLSLRPEVVTNDRTSHQPQTRTVQIKLLGAGKSPTLAGEDLQPGRVNYFIGNDPAKWHTNVAIYGKIRYKDVYPGIDLVYHGNHGRIEYDFEAKPGSDASRIAFEVRGADQIALNSLGALVLKLGTNELQLDSPVVYQQVAGQRVPVEGGYVVTDATHVAFKLAHYDASKPLVIDPVLVYSTYLGGSGDDEITGIAVDSTGSVYVSGYTTSVDFPLATLGSLPSGLDHVFVAKLDPTGSHLVYADYIGGDNDDYGFAIAVNTSNQIYVTGSTASSNFPVVNAYQASYPGSFNGFLTRISADGSSVLYSTYFGGNGSDMPSALALDGQSNIFVAGNTSSTNFPVVNAYQPAAMPNQGGYYGNYGFLSKFTADGSSLAYSTYFGGSSNVALNCGGTPCWPQPFSSITGMAVDSTGNSYVAGSTNTYDFPVTPGAYLTTNTTQLDATVGFVSKFGSGGNLQDSTYFYETSGFTSINAIAIDNSGSAYVTGAAFGNSTFPITSTTICDPSVSSSACSYGFVTKFDSGVSTLLYSTFLGPNNYGTPASIVLDQNDDAYVLATTSSNSFSLFNGIEGYAGGNDLLLAEIDPSAGSELFATYLGGSADERAVGMALDSAGDLYVAGATTSTDLPTTTGAFQTLLGGSADAFIMKIGSGSAPSVSLNPDALQFSAIPVGTTSQPLQVTLRNMGSSALSLTSIAATANFSESDNCAGIVPTTASCTLTIIFTPSAVGSLTGSIAINDNANGSPHSIGLMGTGLGAVVSLAPASLAFPGTPVGVSSAPQTVTLMNQGNASLSISSILVSGNFAQSNNCGTTVPAAGSCTLSVTFTPAAAGPLTGSITFIDNANGSPQVIPLTGSGLDALVSLAPASLSFASTPVGVSTAAQTVTLMNQGNTSVSILSIQISGDFAQTNNCGTSLAPATNCAFNITFTPASSGNRSGSLTITDNAAGSPHMVGMSGAGADFNITTAQSSATIKAGASATYTVKVAPVGGAFGSAIKLGCSGAPATTTCSLSSSSVTPGSNPATVTVTISTMAYSAAMIQLRQRDQATLAFWMPFPAFGFFGVLVGGSRRFRRKIAATVALFVMAVALLLLSGCAGGTGIANQNHGTTPGTYKLTVTGTSGGLQHSLPLTLTVQ